MEGIAKFVPPLGLNWPELYGFYIYGNESTYVIYVEPNSLAESAGIRAGDKIIELDGDNVSQKSPAFLKEIALKSKTKPPSISVQTASYNAELSPSKNCKYNLFGFTVKGDLPILVDQICSNGPGYLAGMRHGDIIIGLNDTEYKFSDAIRPIINSCANNLIIKFVSLSKQKISTSESEVNAESKRYSIGNEILKTKLERAQVFYNTLITALPNDANKRKKIMEELKKFTETSDMPLLTKNLNDLLVKPQERLLINQIKTFIPYDKQDAFEYLINNPNLANILSKPTKSENESILLTINNNYQFKKNEMTSKSIKLDENETNKNFRLNYNASLNKRTITLKRDLEGKFGFTMIGGMPVSIHSVDPNSPADRAGLKQNDVILTLNGVNVQSKCHRDLFRIIKNCNSNPKIEVIQQNEYVRTEPKSDSINSFTKCELKNNENKTFREKVKEVLNKKEKQILKRILCEYSETKNVDRFLLEANSLLDTVAKKKLWFFIMPTLDYDHRKYVEVFNSKYNNRSTKIYSTCSSIGSLPLRKIRMNKSKSVLQNIRSKTESKDFEQLKEFSSTPNLISNTYDNLAGEDKLQKFAKQSDYLLNFKEKTRIKNALKSYRDKRNISIFVEVVDKILDTKAKRTLWFDIIPLLDEDDQEYSKRILCLNLDFLKEINNENGNNNNLNFASCIYEPGQPDLYLSIDKRCAKPEHTYGLINADLENFLGINNDKNKINDSIKQFNSNFQEKLCNTLENLNCKFTNNSYSPKLPSSLEQNSKSKHQGKNYFQERYYEFDINGISNLNKKVDYLTMKEPDRMDPIKSINSEDTWKRKCDCFFNKASESVFNSNGHFD